MSVRAALLAVALAAGAALAGDEQGRSFGFDPTLKNTPEGARFSVTGTAPGYPEGTALHVMLYVEGRGRAATRLAFIKMSMGDGAAFNTERDWPNQKLCPMVYKVRVEIRLDEQVPPVRKALIAEFGWPAGHCEELGTREIEFGTQEERESFAGESLDKLEKLVRELDRSRAEVLALIEDPAAQPVPGEKLDAAWTVLGEREKRFVEFKNAYVVRLEGELIQRIDSFTATLSRCIKYQRKGQNQKNRLLEVDKEIKNVLAEIESRRVLESSHQQEDAPPPETPSPENPDAPPAPPGK